MYSRGTLRRAAGDEIRTLGGLAALELLQARLAESALEHRSRRVEGGLVSPARGHDREAARSQHAADLGEERRHVELGDEIEGVLLERQVGGIRDLECDATLRVEADPALGPADHLLGEVDAADPRVGKLARDQQGTVSEARSYIQRALGFGADVQEGCSERRQMGGAGPADTLVPGGSATLPVGMTEAAEQRPGEWGSGHDEVDEPADHAIARRRRCGVGAGLHAAIIAGAASRLPRLDCEAHSG